LDWPFSEPPEWGVFVTNDVFLDRVPIRWVARDLDGDWSFSGGMRFEAHQTHLVRLSWVTNTFPDVNLLADLPVGWGAMKVASGWRRYEL
jgi:hypothetical protein